MVKMMNAGILGFFIQQEQIVSQNNMLSLVKAQKLLLKLHQQPCGFSVCCCTWIQGGFWVSCLLWDNSMGL